MKSPRFPRGVHPGPSFAFDDHVRTRRSPAHFLSMVAKAVVQFLVPRIPRVPRAGRHDAVFFPMHQTKYAQLIPLEEALGNRPLFILVPWDLDRVRKFNDRIRAGGADWVYLESVYPRRFFLDLASNLPYWSATALRSPALTARRMAQYTELYGLVHGIRAIMKAAGAKALFTAYEDSWYSSAVSQDARTGGFLTVNAMHGNCYRHDQFFDASILFGGYHLEYLRANTASRTRFVIAGSATIKDSGAAPRPDLARKMIYFDQPACDVFPGPVKAKVMGMLAGLVAGVPGAALSIKPHPAGSDSHLAGFLEAHPATTVIAANDPRSVAEVMEGNGISMTAFSTTGLEAIGNGIVSLFLNPDRALSEGPLAFMGEFAFGDGEALLETVTRLASDAGFYGEYLDRQKRTLEKHYALGPFDYRAFLRGMGLLGAS